MFQDPRLSYLKDILSITKGRFRDFIWRAATGSIQTEESLAGRLQAQWNMGYQPDFERGARLYSVAKQRGWDPRVDIDWSRRISRRELALREDGFLALQLGLEDVCDERELIEMSHAELSWILSQILHGEQGALMLSSQLINLYRQMDGKLFLASQAMDEARHIEAFTTYLDGYKLFEVDFGLKFIVDAFLSTDNWRKQAIGMLVMVEGYALGVFAVLKESAADPLLKDILRFVMRDEGRHVGFGLDAVQSSFGELGQSEREELEDYAFSLVRSVAYARNSHGGFQDIHALYWQYLGPRARRQLSYEELRDMMNAHPLMQEFNDIIFNRNLLPNLQRLGLLSPRILPRYEEIGLCVA